MLVPQYAAQWPVLFQTVKAKCLSCGNQSASSLFLKDVQMVVTKKVLAF